MTEQAVGRARGAITVRRLGDDDLDAYLALRDGSFGYPPGDAIRATFRERFTATWGAFDGGTLAATLADPRFEVYAAGVRVGAAGIAAVQTSPERRREGLAARLMHRSLDVARADGVGWSLLYPFDPRFYARYGWQSLTTGVLLELPPDRLGRPDAAGAARVGGDLRGTLQELYGRCAAQWTFANARTIGPWDPWADMLPQAGRRGLAYRMDDAYAILQLRDEHDPLAPALHVTDHGHASPAGRRALLGLLASFVGQASKVVIDVSASDPLAWDWSGWFGRRGRKILMVRVADVPSALAPLRASGAAAPDLPAITIAVRDPFAPWNEGSWRVAPGPDGCEVGRAPSAEATIDVAGLTLLVSGAATPQAVRSAGLAEGDERALRVLAALAGGRTPYQAPEDAF